MTVRPETPPPQAIGRPNYALRRLAVCALVGITLAGTAGVEVALSQATFESVDSRREYNVKAVTLYAFGKYVTWPETAFESATSPFIIAVLGPDPFSGALDQIAKVKTIENRPIVIKRFAKPEDYSNCHILFISRSFEPELEAKLLEQLAHQPVLLVGESPGFALRGGIINFVQSGSNIRFELNPDKAIEAKLNLSAKLLTLGTKVSARQ
jgi:hypothetical protein